MSGSGIAPATANLTRKARRRPELAANYETAVELKTDAELRQWAEQELGEAEVHELTVAEIA